MFAIGLSMQVSQKPSSPPPMSEPQYCPFLKNTGPEYIEQYLNTLVYVWTTYRNSFWMYPIDLVDNSLFGYAWDGSDWKYIRLDLNLIDSLY